MELLQLFYFRETAKTENMTEAAGILHVTQPSLSKAIDSPAGRKSGSENWKKKRSSIPHQNAASGKPSATFADRHPSNRKSPANVRRRKSPADLWKQASAWRFCRNIFPLWNIPERYRGFL